MSFFSLLLTVIVIIIAIVVILGIGTKFNFDFLKNFKFPELKIPDFNPNQNDNSSSIAGDTIVQEDGSTIFIPEDTIVNPDGTVSGSPPILTLSPKSKETALTALEANRLKTIAENEAFAKENNIDLTSFEITKPNLRIDRATRFN